ncbi:GNAT family N-acetyltransferase [Mucilaginibacter dorajii]|uniref:N-acetyltransferase domain-containing protein n=1 Tax=Mucilaginibacter dorajii TaxID=692994 RepID=A0ABP7P1W3_9SPHI|nr:GNAT family N-acetyltransferase [Mucilaginibacter dorajii]MCS3735559.1 GNAT superfamily N-acetyltransferase [Mucilaginibacter dorajii]
MEVQPFNDNDVNLLVDLQPDGWPDITPSFRFYKVSSFCFPIKIIIDGKIAGIGATIIHHKIAWLGHIIVHPEHRGKGIGGYITKKLIDIANQHDCETINLVATDLGAPVYEKAGFTTETEYFFFKDIHIASALSPLVIPYKKEFREQIAEIDYLTSQEDRVFLFEEHLTGGLVYFNNNMVEGFYLPTLGEGLIIANTRAAGIELLKVHFNANDKVAFPKDNLYATTFLHENGYKEIRTAKRMILGKKRNVILSNIYNRIAGNIG